MRNGLFNIVCKYTYFSKKNNIIIIYIYFDPSALSLKKVKNPPEIKRQLLFKVPANRTIITPITHGIITPTMCINFLLFLLFQKKKYIKKYNFFDKKSKKSTESNFI